MARFHVSRSVPTKHEAIATWLPTQPWGPPGDAEIRRLGSFHFDDPEGEVGMETHLLAVDDTVFAVPVTYRAAPLQGGEHALVGTIEHSVLGTRWIHDGLADDRYLTLLLATALTGQGPALGLAEYEGSWFVAPSELVIEGGGWGSSPVAVDGLVVDDLDRHRVTAASERFELTFDRRPEPGEQPGFGLRVSGAPVSHPLVVVSVRDLGAAATG